MAARAYWKGFLRLSLVPVPVAKLIERKTARFEPKRRRAR